MSHCALEGGRTQTDRQEGKEQQQQQQKQAMIQQLQLLLKVEKCLGYLPVATGLQRIIEKKDRVSNMSGKKKFFIVECLQRCKEHEFKA